MVHFSCGFSPSIIALSATVAAQQSNSKAQIHTRYSIKQLAMAELQYEPNPVTTEALQLLPSQKVLLIAGPAGSGKSTMGARIGRIEGWSHLSEDCVWNELPREPHTARTEEEKAVVQQRTLGYVQMELRKGKSVVLEFIVYENPPQPILFYRSELEKCKAPVQIKVLRPSLQDILARQELRANVHDRESPLAARKANAEHQLLCLSSDFIQPDWVVDSSGLSVEEVYARHF